MLCGGERARGRGCEYDRDLDRRRRRWSSTEQAEHESSEQLLIDADRLILGGGEGGLLERGIGGNRPPLPPPPFDDAGPKWGDMRRGSLRGEPGPIPGGGERRRISPGETGRRSILIGDLRPMRDGGDGDRGRRFGSIGGGLRPIGEGEGDRRRIGPGEGGEMCRLRIGGNGDGERRCMGRGERGERLRLPFP